MTDEQIKQNAEVYASKLIERDYHEDIWLDLYDAFMSGAHSRDEEIRQLRNPWISVKERLPDYPESEYDMDNMYLVCREGGPFIFVAIFRRNGKWYIYDHMQTTEIIAPDYWRPMPTIPQND